MTKTGNSNWKTPLGYYEKSIEELRRTREELQSELETLREIKADYTNLKAELEATKQELQETKAELHKTRQHVENYTNIKAELEATKQELQETKAELQKTRQHVENLVTKAQVKADSAVLKIESVQAGIETGSIVAQKALMLQGKDDKHWMRFHNLDGVNHHCFQVWRSDNNTWHDDIRVKAAFFLQATDDKHWLRFKYLKDGYSTFRVWKGDNTWHRARI